MKANKKQLASQKKIVQQKLEHFKSLNEPIPPSGWVKAIRRGLGLTIRQLAKRVGVGHGSIAQLEKREPRKKVTLESLENVARAMDCKLIYAIVPIDPENNLDDIIKNRATAAARIILNDVAHSMRLENQGTSEKHIQAEVERIAKILIESSDPRVWENE